MIASSVQALAVDAIAFEKKIKGWIRARKIALIEEWNPGWFDLHTDEGLEVFPAESSKVLRGAQDDGRALLGDALGSEEARC